MTIFLYYCSIFDIIGMYHIIYHYYFLNKNKAMIVIMTFEREVDRK